MNKCSHCGAQYLDGHVYCSKCGASLIGVTGQLIPGSLLEERYVIIRTLGRGGMGAVYLAHDRRLNNMTVAIKEMATGSVRPGNLQMAIEAFKQEAETLSKLRHPALPRITDFFSQGDTRWYLVMDYIEGDTLQAVASRGDPIPESDILDWARQLCVVLDFLHSKKPPVIFRDLKPSNILITPEGSIKLIDFGIARHFKPDLTTDTIAYGSLGFAPPEQYGGNQTDARSDIYALGATLHYLLTGVNPSQKPFIFESPGEKVTISPKLESAIMSALELKPENRPASAREMLELLVVFCPECKKEVNNTKVRFCPHCGFSLSSLDQENPFSPATEVISLAVCPHSNDPVQEGQEIFHKCELPLKESAEDTTILPFDENIKKSLTEVAEDRKKCFTWPPINRKIPLALIFAALVVIMVVFLQGYSLERQMHRETIASPKERDKTPSKPQLIESQEEEQEKQSIEKLLYKWVATFREKNVFEHMACYANDVERYFNNYNESNENIYRNKEQMMARYESIKMSIDNLEISLESSDCAVATFNKKWDASGAETFAGEELQRIKLRKINGDWKITSEEELEIYWVVKNGKKIM